MLRFERLQVWTIPVRAARRRLADALAHGVAVLGGLGTLASIIVVLAFLVVEVAPLWRPARVDPGFRVLLPRGAPVLGVATDEYREFVQTTRSDGTVEWIRFADGAPFHQTRLPALDGLPLVAVVSPRPGELAYWRADGVLIAAKVGIRSEFGLAGREAVPEVREVGRWVLLTEESVPRMFAASAYANDAFSAAWVRPDGTVEWWAARYQRSLLGDVREKRFREVLPVSGVTVRALALDRSGSRLVLGTDAGMLEVWQRDGEEVRLLDRRNAGRDASITVVGFLLGERAFVVGDSSGAVSVWQVIPVEASGTGYQAVRMHEVQRHRSPVTLLTRSERNRSFATADATGVISLHYSTSARTLATIAGDAVNHLVFAPKGDALLGVKEGSEVQEWVVENPHPETTLRTLFGKVWYEGYQEPTYVWQSTGGTDDFEPKLSLVPLIFGTIKGTLYALVFAVPIAVLGAIYVSQFSPPTLRTAIKPVVELMAALPSVVLGFVAGIVLAPAIEKNIVGVLLALPLAPLAVFTAGMAWHVCPSALRSRMPQGGEVVAATLLLAATLYACWMTSAYWERWLFAGDFRHWLSEAGLGRFDQRNSLVVGLAMGFAVIPLIFTIAEDALASVPQRLVSASLALGATRWQTALYVVLPAASPGIFSAIMIGFGRAVGETMIVLMATGNTPIMDWSIFTGMRTLSANIAVEIPEAPYGSTLYRVLFLAALLLFVMTFIVNTLAEVVRQRLRERYQRL